MPWLRLWVDMLDSEKIAGLSDADFRGWALVLVAVKRHDLDGLVPSVPKLAHWIRRSVPETEGLLARLTKAGFLEPDEDSKRVHDWDYWQGSKDQTNAERQRRYRWRRRDAENSAPLCTPPRTDTDTEQSRGAPAPAKGNPMPENEKMQTLTEDNLAEVSRNAVTVPLRNDVNNVQKCFKRVHNKEKKEEETRPNVTPLRSRYDAVTSEDENSKKSRIDEENRVAELAGDLAGDVSWITWAQRRIKMGDPPAWIEAALRAMVDSGTTSQAYAGKILARFTAQGGPDSPPAPRRPSRNSNGEVPYVSKPARDAPSPRPVNPGTEHPGRGSTGDPHRPDERQALMRVRNGEILDGDIPELTADGRLTALERSTACPECGGGGFVVVDATTRPGAFQARSSTCAATCVCVMGRWIRAWHHQHERSMLERLPDLGKILAGFDRHWTYDAGSDDDDDGGDD